VVETATLVRHIQRDDTVHEFIRAMAPFALATIGKYFDREKLHKTFGKHMDFEDLQSEVLFALCKADQDVDLTRDNAEVHAFMKTTILNHLHGLYWWQVWHEMDTEPIHVVRGEDGEEEGDNTDAQALMNDLHALTEATVAMMEFVRSLHKRHQRILELYIAHDWDISEAEVAARLHINQSTVSRDIDRIREEMVNYAYREQMIDWLQRFYGRMHLLPEEKERLEHDKELAEHE